MVDNGKSSWEKENWSLSFVSSRKATLQEYFDDIWSLNKRSEFINYCKHQTIT